VKQHIYKGFEVTAGGLLVWWPCSGECECNTRREVRGRFHVCDSKLLERSAVSTARNRFVRVVIFQEGYFRPVPSYMTHVKALHVTRLTHVSTSSVQIL
jgi:hypothetical protein